MNKKLYTLKKKAARIIEKNCNELSGLCDEAMGAELAGEISNQDTEVFVYALTVFENAKRDAEQYL